MDTINHTQSHDAVEGLNREEGLLKYSNLSDDDLLSTVWKRDMSDVNENIVLIHELAFRFENALTYW